MSYPCPTPVPVAFPPHVALDWCRRRSLSGQEFRHLLCDPMAFPDQLGLDTAGFTWFEHGLVLYSAAEPVEYLPALYVHETYHVAAENLDKRMTESAEELAISGTDRRLAYLLAQDGWSMPPLPKGYGALAKRARERYAEARLAAAVADCPGALRPDDAPGDGFLARPRKGPAQAGRGGRGAR